MKNSVGQELRQQSDPPTLSWAVCGERAWSVTRVILQHSFTRASWRSPALFSTSGCSGWTLDLPCRSPRRCLIDVSRSSHFDLCREGKTQTSAVHISLFIPAVKQIPPHAAPTRAACPWWSEGTSWQRSGPALSCNCWWRWHQRGVRSWSQREDKVTSVQQYNVEGRAVKQQQQQHDSWGAYLSVHLALST